MDAKKRKKRVCPGAFTHPSSLKFTAHSSISPKTSKRRFNSVRVQSDLSRPTYTTRLSSCSLKRKDRGRLKGGACFFPFPLSFCLHPALMNWSWSLLWILQLTPAPCFFFSLFFLSPFSFCLSVFLCDWFNLLSCYLIELQIERPQSALAPQFLFFPLPLSLCNSSTGGRVIFIKWCHVLSLLLLLVKSKNKAVEWLSPYITKAFFFQSVFLSWDFGVKLTTRRHCCLMKSLLILHGYSFLWERERCEPQGKNHAFPWTSEDDRGHSGII